jgi:hypothetical protein
LPQDTLQKLKQSTEASETVTFNTRYFVEKAVVDMEGYISRDLLAVKISNARRIDSLKLSSFNSVIPEMYAMSYWEYQRIMDELNLPDYKTLIHFRSMIFAALRLDIIRHARGGVNLTTDMLEDVHNFDLNAFARDFTKICTEVMDAMAKFNPDPNPDSFNKLYEARQLNRITVNLREEQQPTGFEGRAVAETPENTNEEGDETNEEEREEEGEQPLAHDEDGFTIDADPDQNGANWDGDGNNVVGG